MAPARLPVGYRTQSENNNKAGLRVAGRVTCRAMPPCPAIIRRGAPAVCTTGPDCRRPARSMEHEHLEAVPPKTGSRHRQRTATPAGDAYEPFAGSRPAAAVHVRCAKGRTVYSIGEPLSAADHRRVPGRRPARTSGERSVVFGALRSGGAFGSIRRPRRARGGVRVSRRHRRRRCFHRRVGPQLQPAQRSCR